MRETKICRQPLKTCRDNNNNIKLKNNRSLQMRLVSLTIWEIQFRQASETTQVRLIKSGKLLEKIEII